MRSLLDNQAVNAYWQNIVQAVCFNLFDRAKVLICSYQEAKLNLS